MTTTNEIDFDADGWTRSDGDVGKCDLESTINPGVDEACNRIDDDCSGGIDEDLCEVDYSPGHRPTYLWCIDGDWERGRRCP